MIHIIKEFFIANSYIAVLIGLPLLGLYLLHKHHVNILDKMWDKEGNAIPNQARKIKQTELVPLRTYHDTLGWYLEKLDQYLGPKAFGPGSYDWCLRLAIAYPIISIFFIWAITAENTSGIQGFLPDTTLTRRLIFVLGLCGCFFAFYKFGKSRGWRRLIWVILAFVVAFTFAFSVADTIADADANAGSFAVASAGAFTFTFAFTFAFAFAVSGTVAVAVAGLGAFAAAFAITFAGTIAVAFAETVTVVSANAVAFSLNISVAFASSTAVVFAVVFSVAASITFAAVVAFSAVILCLHSTLTKCGREATSYTISWLFYITILLMLSYFLGPVGLNTGPIGLGNSHSLLIFLATLPLINVIFDWLSLGVTRHLLRKTLEGANPILSSLLDLLVAIIILISLAITTITFLQLMNLLATAGDPKNQMINLANVLATLRNQPWNISVWWIYIILFSTLLPTFVHAFIATGHLVTLGIPRQFLAWQRWALKTGFNNPHDYNKLLITARYMTAYRLVQVITYIALIAVPVTILWTLAWGLPQLAQTILYIVEATAAAMGVEITPVYQKWWAV